MGTAYEQAGVSLGKAESIVAGLRTAVESTRTSGVAGELGGFVGLFALDDERLLAATTDGVGTKLILARRADRLRDAGADLAAHCINDVSTCGADPLFMLDYVASAKLDLEQVAELVEGAAAVCRTAGCAILGGETAEMPDVYAPAEIDFVGTCVGLVQRSDLVDGSRIAPGDVVIGLPSSGLHANGFTLVRQLIGEGGFDADLLLAPTRCYRDDIVRLRHSCDVRGLAHITGGGIPGNLARALPAGLGALIDAGGWERHPVFAWLDEQGVPESEQRSVFNLGIGMCAVVPPADASRADFPTIGTIDADVDGVVFS
ncbi:MAG: phosphoribosylformylglycinamidine cyclo-ligase [Gaiellaceae bacterium]